MYKRGCIRFICIVVSFLAVGCSKQETKGWEGILLKSSDQTSVYIIDQDGGPILISNETEDEHIFADLQSGDTISVVSSEILESYPEQTTIYECELIKRGNVSDIPDATLDDLHEMGYKFDIDE